MSRELDRRERVGVSVVAMCSLACRLVVATPEVTAKAPGRSQGFARQTWMGGLDFDGVPERQV